MNTSTDRSKTRAWTLAPDYGAIVEVPAQGYAPGLYLVALDGEGLRIGTGKFELTR
jgi:hypothetical protein